MTKELAKSLIRMIGVLVMAYGLYRLLNDLIAVEILGDRSRVVAIRKVRLGVVLGALVLEVIGFALFKLSAGLGNLIGTIPGDSSKAK